MIDNLRAMFENQFLSGGLVLMAVGAVLLAARQWAGRIVTWLIRQVMVEIEVRNNSHAFEWFMEWLHGLPYAKTSRRLTVLAMPAPEEGFRIVLTPAPGNHIFLYHGRPIWLIRERSDDKAAGGEGNLASALRPQEGLRFRLLGRSQELVRAIVDDAKRAAERAIETEPRIMVSTYGYWRRRATLADRSLQSVILPGDTAESVLDDAQEFLASKQWYAARSIPYRRGYLLHGLTGSGKTSLVAAIASELRLELYVLNVRGDHMSDDRLMDLMGAVPQRAILLLEDVDTVTRDRQPQRRKRRQVAVGRGEQPVAPQPSDEAEQVSLSALLNAIDGLSAPDGCLMFMTTNYLDRLDEALIRPGRVDTRVEFDYATPGQMSRMYRRFFDGQAPPVGFERNGKDMTMAEVQEFCLRHRNDPAEAARALQGGN